MGLLHLVNCRISWLTIMWVFLSMSLHAQQDSITAQQLEESIRSTSGFEKLTFIHQYIELRDHHSSLVGLADEAIQLAHQENAINDSLLGETYLLKANIYYGRGKWAASLPYIIKAHEYFQTSKNVNKQTSMLIALARCYRLLNENAKSDSMVHLAVELCADERLNLSSWKSIVAAIDLHARKSNDFLFGIEKLLIIKPFIDTTNALLMNQFYNNIAAIYVGLKRYPEGINHYLLALNQSQTGNINSVNRTITYQGLVNVYNLMDSLDTANRWLDSALYNTEVLENPNRRIALFTKKASIALVQKKFALAEKYALDSRKLSHSINRNPAAFNQITLGLAYNGLGQYKKALTNCTPAVERLKEKEKPKLFRQACQCLNVAYEAIGNTKKALHYSNLSHTSLKNSTQFKTEREIAQLEAKYQIEKEQKEQELRLQKEQAVYALDVQRRKNTRNFLLLSLAAAGLLSFFLFRSNRRKKEINKLLKDKQELTASALHEKDTLLREIHHRVKNNLQVISSLLFIQSQNFESEEVKQAIDQSRNRVRSMALIHQNLYQKDNLSGVPVRNYFTKLISELFEAYNISDDRLSFRIDIDEIDLDVETMVPIGLVCNELISNALKHAFPGGRTGELYVRINEIDKVLHIQISDDGIGNSMEIMQSSNSMGKRLVELFCKKLNAEITYDFVQGTSVNIAIQQYKKT